MNDTQSGTIYIDSDNKSKAQEVQKLEEFALSEPAPILTIRGVFPFDFIPNEVTIFRNKISINRKHFPWIAKVTNIPLENVNYVTVHASLLFATLEISDIYFTEHPVYISKLWKRDAYQAMQAIDGLRLALKQKIDVSKIPDDQILNEALKIGSHSESREVKQRQ